jgi:Ca-activated chloride channel family protein
MLWLFIALPLGLGWYLRLQRQRRERVARYGSFGLAPDPARRRPTLHQHLPPAFFLLALTMLILALARPETVVSLPRVEGIVILAFDVSGSMAADDLAPTRMEAAKVAARAFVEQQPTSVLIGVVAFSDSGFAVQAPTADRDTILASIGRLAPQRGTSLGNGILMSLNAIFAEETEPLTLSNLTPAPTPTPTPVPRGTYLPAAIVLLTDGENNEAPDPLAAALAAAERGVRIYTVGIGSEAGAILNIDGFSIHSRLDEATLQQIALLTDGAYYSAQTAQDLHTVYDTLNPQLVLKPEKMELTSILAGLSILSLLIGGALSLLWFSRLP